MSGGTLALGMALIGLAAACAELDRAPPGPAANIGPPVTAAIVAEATVNEPAVAEPLPVAVVEPLRSEEKKEASVALAPPARAPAKVTAPAVAVEQPQKIAEPVAVARSPEPTLDVAGLTARLRDTKAIGVFTKLALKNQVDDLLEQFRVHYGSGQKTSVASLRPPYDMLVLKVLALLQDSDPPLARMISGSREAIWGILADPEKFNSIV